MSLASRDDDGMWDTIQWRQYENLGSAGVGASGSMSMRVKVEPGEGVGVMEMVGWVEAWWARMRVPSEGEMEGKVTVREMEGVKVEGMATEGRRLADLREGRRVVKDIFFGD